MSVQDALSLNIYDPSVDRLVQEADEEELDTIFLELLGTILLFPDMPRESKKRLVDGVERLRCYVERQRNLLEAEEAGRGCRRLS